MIIKIKSIGNIRFFISIEDYQRDNSIANLLNIEIQDYVDLLIKYEATKSKLDGEFSFDTYNKCEKFLNSPELEPYIVMTKLTEGLYET